MCSIRFAAAVSAVVTGLGLGGAATAQPPPLPIPPAPPRSLQFIVTASNSYMSVAGTPATDPDGIRRQSEQLAATQGIKDVFESVSDGTAVALRHRPSGLVCITPKVVIVPKAPRPAAFDPAAQSGCAAVKQGHQVDVMVLPNGEHTRLADAMEALVMQAEREQAGLEEVAGSREVLRRNATARLVLTTEAEPRYLRLTVAKKRDWVILVKARCTYDRAAECDALADETLAQTVPEIGR